jgi:hypothetical protein
MSIDTDTIMIETEIIKNECREFQRTEEDLHLELDSSRFFFILEKDFNYSYKTISRLIQGSCYTPNEQHEFNITLRRLKMLYNIDIMDSILYLEDTIMLSNILKFIDDETEWMLKEELSAKFCIDVDVKTIFDFMS